MLILPVILTEILTLFANLNNFGINETNRPDFDVRVRRDTSEQTLDKTVNSTVYFTNSTLLFNLLKETENGKKQSTINRRDANETTSRDYKPIAYYGFNRSDEYRSPFYKVGNITLYNPYAVKEYYTQNTPLPIPKNHTEEELKQEINEFDADLNGNGDDMSKDQEATERVTRAIVNQKLIDKGKENVMSNQPKSEKYQLMPTVKLHSATNDYSTTKQDYAETTPLIIQTYSHFNNSTENYENIDYNSFSRNENYERLGQNGYSVNATPPTTPHTWIYYNNSGGPNVSNYNGSNGRVDYQFYKPEEIKTDSYNGKEQYPGNIYTTSPGFNNSFDYSRNYNGTSIPDTYATAAPNNGSSTTEKIVQGYVLGFSACPQGYKRILLRCIPIRKQN